MGPSGLFQKPLDSSFPSGVAVVVVDASSGVLSDSSAVCGRRTREDQKDVSFIDLEEGRSRMNLPRSSLEQYPLLNAFEVQTYVF